MKSIKHLICVLLIPILLFGCAAGNHNAYSAVKQDYQDMQSKQESMAEDELYLAYAELFGKIAEGDVSEQAEFATLFRDISHNKVAFQDNEVFDLAKLYAEFYTKLADKSTEVGIQDVNFTYSEIQIPYFGEMRYSVKMIQLEEDWYDNYTTAPYNGELGEYLLEISFYDVRPIHALDEKYHHNTLHSITVPFGEDQLEMSLKCEHTADHGYKIYIGSDAPFQAEELPITTLNKPFGSVTVPFTKP